MGCTEDMLDGLKDIIGNPDNEQPNIADICVPNNQIWYTNGSTTERTTPYNTDVFGANIILNTFDAEKECWFIEFDGDVTTIGELAFLGCSSLTSVTIPDSVTTIGYAAFNSCSSLTSITIPDSVTTIGGGTFAACSSLTSVTIPDSVTTVGSCAFDGCSSLTSVTIGDSVTEIGYQAFAWCDSLTSITIPDSVTTIGYSVFAECSNLREFNGKYASGDGRCLIIDGTLNSFAPAGLTEYVIPDSVTTIGYYAFHGCSSLTSVTIPDSVTTIEWDAFSNCSSLTRFNGKYASDDGRCLIIDGTLNSFAPAGLTEYVIPDSVTTIGVGAFSGCSSLTKFNGKFASEDGRCLIIDGTLNSFAPAEFTEYTIPNSVTAIGDEAFSNCDSLTSVTIPNSVTTIGRDAFYNCSSLTSVTIGDSVTTIGDLAFNSCSSLTSITIPDSVTTIGNWAFYNCSSLTSATIGDSVTTIGDLAFYGCSSLTSVTIPDSVTTIGELAFYGCSSLTSVTIGNSVTTIGDLAFYGCSSLTSVYCKATTPPTGGFNMFDGNASDRKIYVPTGSVEAYKSASGWSEYADAIVGYDF